MTPSHDRRMSTTPEIQSNTPKVFLSFTFDDQPLAKRIAHTLQANGIDTWWAEWCIAPGESIRQRIEEGLGSCTHFLVLLTPASVTKPWVAAEMDAGLVAKLSRGTKFIALRSGLSPSQMPPLLQGLLSPDVDPNSLDLTQLINDTCPCRLPLVEHRARRTSSMLNEESSA